MLEYCEGGENANLVSEWSTTWQDAVIQTL
jgi:hypothetical protein